MACDVMVPLIRYADLVESHRLAECCSMVKHIRKGLSMVVPISVSRYLTLAERAFLSY